MKINDEKDINGKSSKWRKQFKGGPPSRPDKEASMNIKLAKRDFLDKIKYDL